MKNNETNVVDGDLVPRPSQETKLPARTSASSGGQTIASLLESARGETRNGRLQLMGEEETQEESGVDDRGEASLTEPTWTKHGQHTSLQRAARPQERSNW